MSADRTPGAISELLAGRWQIPLALVAALTAGVTLYRLVPAPPPVNFDALLADVALLTHAGDLSAAADAVASLLELQPPLPPEQQAILHQRLADLLYEVERLRSEHSHGNLTKLLEHSQAALRLGAVPSPAAMLRDAFAHQWLGNPEAALKGLRAVLAQNITPNLRRTATRALVEVLEHNPGARRERRAALEELLADVALPAPYAWWGLRAGVQDALDDKDPGRARQLLTQYGQRLKSSDLDGYLEYLTACVTLHEGRPEEAEPVVRWVDEWLGAQAQVTAELDDFGHLGSLNRWLTGQVHLALGRPREALSAFEDALDMHSSPEVRIAATVGRSRALAALGRHRAAVTGFQEALRKLSALPLQYRRAVTEFQSTLLSLFDDRRADGDIYAALAYAALGGALKADDSGVSPELAREWSSSPPTDEETEHGADVLTWTHLQRAIDFLRFDESRLSWLVWTAAETFNQAGRPDDVRRALQVFVRGRTTDARLPQAMLRLGQAYEACGDPAGALAWYERVALEYPLLAEAARAQVLAAAALVSMGEESYPQAERILTDLLVNGALAPDSLVYRDALLNLCELLYHEGRYADAISRLEDFLQLYPQDEERHRVEFTLADAYRRSAYALRTAAPSDSSAPAAEATSRRRFREAAERYEALLSSLEAVPGLDEARHTYARLAALYRGDCLFELNEPEALQAALVAYRAAAARYDGQPTALVARVQIANVLLRLGDVAEAARAVEGARGLLRGIPAEVWQQSPSGDLEHWDRLLSTVSASELFSSAFVSTPGYSQVLDRPRGHQGQER